jgi:hypothetical protein
MKAKSIKGNSMEDIRVALQQAREDGFNPTLAIVFISIKQNRDAIRTLLHGEGLDVFGATSCGEFVDGYQGKGSIAILLLDIPRDSYALHIQTTTDDAVRTAGQQLGQKAGQLFPSSSIILCCSRLSVEGGIFDGETFVNGVLDILGDKTTIVGGMAGDDMTFTGSYVFTHEGETVNGYAALILDASRVTAQGLAITGWKPMGISRTITRSDGPMIYTIDDKPAVDMYLQYLGKQGKGTAESAIFMNELSLHYPFIVERAQGGTFLHTPLRVDEESQALVIDVPMPVGTKFWFSVPPDFDIVDEVLGEANRIARDETADALLVFSCAGRINVLGPLVQSENEGLHELWKAPMAGFFTYGEFGRDQLNKTEFHSGACSWVTLKSTAKP